MKMHLVIRKVEQTDNINLSGYPCRLYRSPIEAGKYQETCVGEVTKLVEVDVDL